MSDTSKNGLLAVCGSFIVLSTVTVALRFWARKKLGLSLGVDSWTALFGVITHIGACACAFELVKLKALGYDSSTLSSAEAAANLKPTVQFSIAYDFLNMNTMYCAKLSALFLYRRLFSVARYKGFDAIVLLTVAVMTVWYITFDILSCFQCRSHFSAPWHGEFSEYCDLNPVWANGLAVSDFLLDLWVLLLPIPKIWRLQLDVAKKLGVVGVFLLACVGLGASIARVVIFFTHEAPGSETLYIGLLESGMTITVVNFPAIWYICVSTIPTQLRRGLDSLTRVYSKVSMSIYPTSDHSTSTVNAKTGAAVYAVENNSSWNTRAPSSIQEFRSDPEGGSFRASAAQGVREPTEHRHLDSLPTNVIRVHNEVEVWRA